MRPVSVRLFHDGIRIFKVSAEQVVRPNKSIRKARLLRIVEEVPPSLSKLLPLL